MSTSPYLQALPALGSAAKTRPGLHASRLMVLETTGPCGREVIEAVMPMMFV